MKAVNSSIRKKDAISLVTGKPVYTDDLAPDDCLIVKVVRSPHAHAIIEKINTEVAEKVQGIACILTYKEVPNQRFTMAGQTYPEPSPYDRYILDQRLRFVGDAVAIVAGENLKAVEKAMSLIQVTYQVLEPILDFHKAKDHPTILVHPEEDWKALCPVGADNKRNLCSCGVETNGDINKTLDSCEYVVEGIYHTKANQQAMMETFRTYTYMDVYGRLNVVAATQVPFHVRRILAQALDLPKSKIRVIKPRIGGGFGAKQTVVAEVYPAIVTLKTGRPAKCIYTREESQIASSPRHEMEIKVRIGADKEGIIKAIDVYTLSNTGAYGEHGPTTVGLAGHKSIPIYGKVETFQFSYDVVYTNVMSAGAYRGYGATQGIFAVESAVNELAVKMNIDPVLLREKNMVKQGQVMPAYYDETAGSCTLDQCMARAKEMMDWDRKFKKTDIKNGSVKRNENINENGNGSVKRNENINEKRNENINGKASIKLRGVGVAMAMQGSAIPMCDTAAVSIKVNDDGFYSLMIGAADMGTGCDTILAQIAADCLYCSIDMIVVHGVDTDTSPYDSGSYASSTTYLTGMAVIKTCDILIDKIKEEGAKTLNCKPCEVDFDGKKIYSLITEESIDFIEVANQSMCGNENTLFATASHTSPISPPPFMVGMAEVEVDTETGKVELIDYCAVVDCGTVINPNLARVQVEGGIVQGMGMALFENIQYNKKGKVSSNSFMQYKLPSRQDIGEIRVEFKNSYEETGPFGAKSIGEIVINTPAPAIVAAVYHACGVSIKELPITPEKIVRGINKRNS